MPTSSALLALGLVALPAAAQEVRWGLSLGAFAPQGELRDFAGNEGSHLGVFLDLNLGRGHVLRPVWDLLAVEGKDREGRQLEAGSGRIVTSRGEHLAALSQLGVAWLWFPSGSTRGFHTLLGGGLQSTVVEARWMGPSGKTISNRMYGTLGVGWTLGEHWALQVRYFQAPYHEQGGNPSSGRTQVAAGTLVSVQYCF